ncbi:MAG: precorrin-6y C5,15-methyltransferase (decarboxylating) subunit CbiE [Candidatus Atribacteria bacterium]|nr:precorrin-6y C5,15-methyltransferase (decarboxylating) subunit CbiE [Candidatus Atribacteria bacterium]
MVTVVGIGPGTWEYVTPAALQKIEGADVLVGGKRQLALFQDIDCIKIPFEKGMDFPVLFHRTGQIVILASGDPGLYGVLNLVLKYVSKEYIEVIPGISSVQYIMAKLRMPMKNMAVISLHGREEDIASKVKEYDTLVVLTDENHDPRFIAQILKQGGIKDRIVYVGQNLSYENEKIERYTVEELMENQKKFDINLVVITCGNMPLGSLMSVL